MKRALAKFFLKLTGWNCYIDVTEELKHSVMIAAPHTSNWDFPIAICAFWLTGVKAKFFIKDFYTKGLFGSIFKALGAIGVDRTKKNNQLTDYAIQLLKDREEVVIAIPVEGTRKRVEKWRTGFYRIATEAQVPICLGYVDYVKKEAGVVEIFKPTGDFEKDMSYIQNIYIPFRGKNPENYNPEIF